MITKIPTKYFLVAGSSEGMTNLNSFDGALLNACIGNTNLIKVSSILPPNCKNIEPIQIPYGAIVPIAYASITSQLEGEVIAAAVAVAIPEDDKKPGLIMEYSARGRREDIEEIVRNMAKHGMELRGEKIKEIKSIATQHKVTNIGTAFAGVVLWD